MKIYMDIETLGTTDAVVIADIAKTISPPGNIKLPESIAKWHSESGAQALADAVAKTSFDGSQGRIACIAWAFDDGEIHCTSSDATEAEAIKTFYAATEKTLEINYHGGSTSTPLQVCGHNIAGFDLPFLKARSIILGIKPPPGIWRTMKAKPWDDCIQDTMNLWDAKKMVGLAKLCRSLGIKDDDDMDGSKVAEMWAANPERVIQYCKNDVEITRKVYKRITFG